MFYKKENKFYDIVDSVTIDGVTTENPTEAFLIEAGYTPTVILETIDVINARIAEQRNLLYLESDKIRDEMLKNELLEETVKAAELKIKWKAAVMKIMNDLPYMTA